MLHNIVKSFFTIGALGLIQWAQELNPGPYKIGSDALTPSELLTRSQFHSGLVFTE